MKIGITGKIGSGKSTVTTFINDISGYNFQVIDCDKIVSMLYDIEHVQYQLMKEFNVCTKAEILNLIEDDGDLSCLNKIFLPYVIGYILALPGNCIIEVPLLFENNLKYLFDCTINIYSNEKLRSKRISIRNPETARIFKLIDSSQKCDESRNSLATYIIENNSSVKLLVKNVYKITNKIL